MRHKRRGRHLGRTSSHRKALLRNLACSLFLTERDPDYYEGMTQADGKSPVNPPKFPGRIVTTLHKAKEVRPLVEKCITIAKKTIPSAQEAEKFGPKGERGTDAYKQWRKSDDWQKWAAARAPVVAARRRVVQLIGDKEAAAILFDTIAERFVDRPGGYTRIMRLATPRLGDNGERAVLELVGKNDRVKRKAAKPAFDDAPAESPKAEKPADDEPADEKPADDEPAAEAEASDSEEAASESKED